MSPENITDYIYTVRVEEGSLFRWMAKAAARDTEMERELRMNMKELERFSRLAMGRENNMIKLKEEVNKCLSKLGREAKYKIVE